MKKLKKNWPFLIAFLILICLGTFYRRTVSHRYIGEIWMMHRIPESVSVTVEDSRVKKEKNPEQFIIEVEVEISTTTIFGEIKKKKLVAFDSEPFYNQLWVGDRVTVDYEAEKDFFGIVKKERFTLIGKFTGT